MVLLLVERRNELVTPDFQLLLWLILISWAVNAIFYIIAGSMGLEKDDRYGVGTAVVGIINLVAILAVLIW